MNYTEYKYSCSFKSTCKATCISSPGQWSEEAGWQYRRHADDTEDLGTYGWTTAYSAWQSETSGKSNSGKRFWYSCKMYHEGKHMWIVEIKLCTNMFDRSEN